jgi:hypothetical protein
MISSEVINLLLQTQQKVKEMKILVDVQKLVPFQRFNVYLYKGIVNMLATLLHTLPYAKYHTIYALFCRPL